MRGEGLARATESRLTGRLVREPRDMVMIGDQLENGVGAARGANDRLRAHGHETDEHRRLEEARARRARSRLKEQFERGEMVVREPPPTDMPKADALQRPHHGPDDGSAP